MPATQLSHVKRNIVLFTGACIAFGGLVNAGTVAYWRFEEGQPGAAASGDFSILDSSGNGLDGTPVNGPVYRADVPAATVPFTAKPNHSSLQFNGIDQRIAIPDNSKFVLTHSLTLEAYVKPTDTQKVSQIVFRGDDRVGLDAYWLYVQKGDVIFDIENAAQQFAFVMAPLPANQWTYVAGTLDDKTGAMRLYINGVQKSSGTTSVRPLGPLDPNSNPGLGIGNIQSGNYDEHFNGLIDEVRISDQALPASQLLSHASIPGDANRDGVVNFADLLILAQHYGMGSRAVWETGDFNGDDKVDFQDLLLLAQHYHVSPTAGVSSSAVPVPEPAFAAPAAALCLVRRKRR